MVDKYYQLLGLKKENNPDSKKIKKAYRKMALQWHPDRNSKNKKEAERRFKEINEAYEILSDPNKKEKYDLYGEGGFENQSPFTFSSTSRPFHYNIGNNDIFSEMFNTGRMGGLFQHYPSPKIKIIKKNIFVSLEELAEGKLKKMKITDKGLSQIIKINIKPGWKGGTKLTYTLKSRNKLEFTILEKPHKYFIRENSNLRWICILTEGQLKKGVKITIPNIYNSNPTILDTRNKYIIHGSEITINGKGMPIKNKSSKGNLIIEFRIKP